MFKVVFIDDETLVKLGLRSMLNWEEEGFEIEGDASNGSEGLDLILKTKPDLVITDIIMPEMDGIEMMKKVRENNLAPIFVFLSSYDQFELVKKAMQLGAKDYLLKLKLNSEMLHDMLDTVKNELEKNSEKAGRKQERSVWETEELRKAFLKKVLIGESALMENDEWQFGIGKKMVRIVYIASNIYHMIANREERERKIYLETIRKLIEDISREFFEAYCIEWENGSFLIFLSGDESDVKSNNLNFMAEAIIEMLMQYSNIQASIGISDSVAGYENFQGAYLQAKTVQQLLAVEGYGKTIFFGQNITTDNNTENRENNSQINTEKFATICETLNLEELEVIEKEAIEELERNITSIDNAVFYCTRFLCLLDEYLQQSHNGYKSEKLNTYIKGLYYSNTISEIVEVFGEYMKNIKEFFRKDISNDQERIVREAKKYIHNHIYENLNLEGIAQALFISSGYLSTIFSKYEPIGVANYINKIKVAEAQQLLTKQRLKVYEVAFKLGYENAGYFAKVFKKYTGYTPKEYRERI